MGSRTRRLCRGNSCLLTFALAASKRLTLWCSTELKRSNLLTGNSVDASEGSMLLLFCGC